MRLVGRIRSDCGFLQPDRIFEPRTAVEDRAGRDLASLGRRNRGWETGSLQVPVSLTRTVVKLCHCYFYHINKERYYTAVR